MVFGMLRAGISVHLKHFFDGQQSRENSASAFLATLLEYDGRFRREFLALVPVLTPLDDSDTWKVKVEDTSPWATPVQGVQAGPGSIDVTMESPSTLVLIENKLAASAKQRGQLRRYYQAAVQRWPDKRIIVLYLGPTADLGNSEVALVRDTDEYKRRQAETTADYVDSFTWVHIGEIIDSLPRGETWFAETGIEAVREAIKRATTALPHDPQRMELRRVVEDVKKRLAEQGRPAEFQRWSSVGAEDIITVKGPVSLFLTVVFDIDPTSSMLRDVVVGDRFRLAIKTEVMLSPRGHRSPTVVAAWNQLLETGSATIEGLGELPVRDKKRFGHFEARDYSEEELKALMVKRAVSVVRFLRPCYDASSK
jgi:hypothetical protein